MEAGGRLGMGGLGGAAPPGRGRVLMNFYCRNSSIHGDVQQIPYTLHLRIGVRGFILKYTYLLEYLRFYYTFSEIHEYALFLFCKFGETHAYLLEFV